MSKKIVTTIIALSLICFICFNLSNIRTSANTSTINLSATVSEALTLGVSANSYAFGALTPGSPVKGSAGINIDVQTSAVNGYTLLLHDGVSGSNSALLHSDSLTRIADYSSSINSPTAWNTGTDIGLGATFYAADTNKEVKWGAGNTFNHAGNNYAGVPETATVFHSSPGYKLGIDRSSIAFILDVPGDQKSGEYSGIITITALPVLD